MVNEEPSPSADNPRLELAGISKRYGAVKVLDDVSMTVRAGEIHALVGENGAGKSTLVKIASGVVRADAGSIRLNGEIWQSDGPASGLAAGIHLVHQELALLPRASVLENLFLGQEIGPAGALHWRAMARDGRRVLDDLGVAIDVHRPVGELSVAHQQMVEIARAMLRDTRLIILDEPTAAIAPADAVALFDVLRRLTREGTSVVYISHRLDETLALADRVTVLKDGRHVDTLVARETDANALIRLMVGRTFEDLYPPRVPARPSEGAPRLDVSGLTAPPYAFDISLAIHAGEIVGLYGLEGNGQDEVAACLGGAMRPVRGTLTRDGERIVWGTVADMARQGIGYVPEDRKSEGLLLPASGFANITLPLLRSLSRFGVPGRAAERALAIGAATAAGIKGNCDAPVGALSGGNQQKILIARWIAARSAVLLVRQPTRGVDVGSKSEIYALLRKTCRTEGAGMLIVSRELPELRGLCDRILVMAGGRLVANHAPGDEEAEILASAVGEGTSGRHQAGAPRSATA